MKWMTYSSPAVAIYTLTIFLAAIIIAYLKGTDTLLTALLGVAAANATTAVNYYLGSSSSSARKDQILHDTNQSLMSAVSPNIPAPPDRAL